MENVEDSLEEIEWCQQWSLVLTGLGNTGLKPRLWNAMGFVHSCNQGGIMRNLEIKVVTEEGEGGKT